MTAQLKDKLIEELKDFPDEKFESLLDYMHYLKNKTETDDIPNEETEQALKDSRQNKNLNTYSSLNDFFNKMDI